MKARGFVLNRSTGEPVAGVNVVARAERDGGVMSLGLLTSDHVGYVSFELPPHVDGGGFEKVWLEVVDQPDSKATVAVNESNGGPPGEASAGAVVLAVDPATVAKGARTARPAVQDPDVRDWELSPYSFSRPREATIGADGCATPYPFAGAARDFIFYRVVRPGPSKRPAKTDREITKVGSSTLATEIEPVDVAASSPSKRVEPAVLVEMRQRWLPLNDSLGEIIYSAALAPCESVDLAIIDWSRRDEITRTDAATATEALYHGQRRDRTIEESVDAVVEESQGGWSLMGGIAASGAMPLEGGGTVSGTGALGAGVSNSWGERGVEADSQQDLHDRIKQHTTLVRSQFGTVVIEATQDERNVLETRTVTNHNHCHALTLQYYEVLRNFRLVTEVLRVRHALLVPFALVTFTPSVALRFRVLLEPRLLDPSLTTCFPALERLERCPDAYTLTVEPEPSKTGGTPVTSGGAADEDERVVSRFEIKIGTTTWNWSTTWGDVWVEVFLKSTSSWKEIWHKDSVGHGGVELNKIQWPQSVGGNQINPEDIDGVRVGWREDNKNDSWDFESIRIDYTIAGEAGTHTLIDERGLNVPSGSKSKKAAIQYFDDSQSKVDTRALSVNPAPPRKAAPTTGRGTTGTGAPAARPRYSRVEDKCCADRLVAHLNANQGYYSRIVWVLQDPVDRRLGLAAALSAYPELLRRIDDTPLALSGNQVAFAYTAEPPAPQQPSVPPAESIVSLPSRGVFAEAQLGHCNACEKRDVTRYWDWAESPCERPTPIGDITPGPRGEPAKVEPAAVPQSVLQVVQPPAAPDPTGLTAALALLGKGDIFRDMSGMAEVRELLSGLAAGSVDLAKATQLAKSAEDKLGRRDGAALDGAAVRTDPRSPAERYDDLQVAREVAAAADELGWDDATTSAVTSAIVGGSGGGPPGMMGVFAREVADLVTAQLAPPTPIVSFDPAAPGAEAQAAHTKMTAPGVAARQATLQQELRNDFGFGDIKGAGVREPWARMTVGDLAAVIKVGDALGVPPAHVLALFIEEGKYPYDALLHGAVALDLGELDAAEFGAGAPAIRAWARSQILFEAFGSDQYGAHVPRGGVNRENDPQGPTADHDGAFDTQLNRIRAAGIPGLAGLTNAQVRKYFTDPGSAMDVTISPVAPHGVTVKLKPRSLASWLYLQHALFRRYERDLEAKFKAEYGGVPGGLRDKPWVTYVVWNGGMAKYDKYFAGVAGGPQVAISRLFGTSSTAPWKLPADELALYNGAGAEDVSRSPLANAVIQKYLVESVAPWFS